jgi:hypothetical protein
VIYMKRAILAALIVIAVLAVGAGAAVYYSQPPSAIPTVSIVSPTSGATVSGTFTVTVATSNFNIPTQGHIHVYLDSLQNYQLGPGPAFTFTNGAPGQHTIWAQLQNPDHSPLNPPVETQPITITVSAPAANPAVSITSPSNGATVSDTFTVTVASTNFNVPSQGHYHVYLDGQTSTEKMAYGQTSTVTFSGVSPGPHTVTVVLANPDHTDLQPLVSQAIRVNVEQSGGNTPTLSITSPADGATVQGPEVTVTLSSTNMPAGGYYYVTVSNGGFITGNGPTFTFPSVTSGTHTITAQLYSADGMPLSPAVSQTVTITVTGGTGGGYGY